jgi:hypothetical protein
VNVPRRFQFMIEREPSPDLPSSMEQADVRVLHRDVERGEVAFRLIDFERRNDLVHAPMRDRIERFS